MVVTYFFNADEMLALHYDCRLLNLCFFIILFTKQTINTPIMRIGYNLPNTFPSLPSAQKSFYFDFRRRSFLISQKSFCKFTFTMEEKYTGKFYFVQTMPTTTHCHEVK